MVARRIFNDCLYMALSTVASNGLSPLFSVRHQLSTSTVQVLAIGDGQYWWASLIYDNTHITRALQSNDDIQSHGLTTCSKDTRLETLRPYTVECKRTSVCLFSVHSAKYKKSTP